MTGTDNLSVMQDSAYTADALRFLIEALSIFAGLVMMYVACGKRRLFRSVASVDAFSMACYNLVIC